MKQEKKIYYSDLYAGICYSCRSQNILHITKGVIGGGYTQKLFCNDCKSKDVGLVPPKEVLE